MRPFPMPPPLKVIAHGPAAQALVARTYSHRPALFSEVGAPVPLPKARVDPVPSPYVSSFVESNAASCICMTISRSPDAIEFPAPPAARVPTEMVVAPDAAEAVAG